MVLFDKNFKELLYTQLFAVIGGLIAGIFLAAYTDKIFLIPGMLIIIPGFMAMRGNISGTLASRISSGLYLKKINPKKLNTKPLRGNLNASFTLAVIVSLAIGLIAFAFSYIVTKEVNIQIILIPLIGGVISTIILTPITLITTIKLFQKGYDPDNIMGPFVTTIGDVTSIISLLIAIIIVV